MDSISQNPLKKGVRGGGSIGDGSQSGSSRAVKFARRTSSGRYVNLSREDLDMSGEISGDYTNYTVHIPSTPDNQPMDASSVAGKAEEQYVSNSLFTGGFNNVARAHLMDKVIDSEVKHPQMAGAKGSACMMPACDGKVMKDERGADVMPCECRFKICRDCFMDAQKAKGLCPGCKESYKREDYMDGSTKQSGGLNNVNSKMDRRMSLMHPDKSMSRGSKGGEFDQIPWLSETKGSYSYDRAFSSKDYEDDEDEDLDGHGEEHELLDRPWRPLSHVLPVPPAIIIPYRILIAVRLVVLCFFLTWRVQHPNEDAVWLWLMSIKHDIEPRNPDSYFSLKGDPTKNKSRSDFVKDRRKIKREYDEFKVRINGLPDSIRRRSDTFNAREEMKMLKHIRETGGDPLEPLKVLKATWMADATHWPGTWAVSRDHSKGDHARILQAMLKPPSSDPLMGSADDEDQAIDFSKVDIRLPMFVYMSREKRPGYDHNKKAGAMNALVRSSAVLSNGPFMLNLDCDHYIYNCKAIREGMCFMMDKGGENVYPSDRYANHNTVFFDGNMRALDGLQVFVPLGFDPPQVEKIRQTVPDSETHALKPNDFDATLNANLLPKRFGNSAMVCESIVIAEFQGRPIADHQDVQYGRPPGILRAPREPLDATIVAEAVSVISCWYEDKTEWGGRVGCIYGSVTEDVVTGYRMHNRGWRSVYCITKRDAFRGSAPINLTDRLHQVLRWATGSVEIFFSRNNAMLGSSRLMLLQRLAYMNVGIYPFTSIFLIVYCFLPAFSLFSGQFIVANLNVTFLVYLLTITICLISLALLEFCLISGTSAHLAAVVQGLLKVVAGIEMSFTLTSKSAGEDVDDIYADLYLVKWTSLMIPPIVIAIMNITGIVVAFCRTIYSPTPSWSKFVGGGFFSFWVLAHQYPFAKGLIAITLSLLWIAIDPPKANKAQIKAGGFQFP
ncbi:hypothetical protein MKX01_005521 [Papaver californicum]|nr:hypothetical protein MKX01_005521 [Papaver californicum]